ncbi:N-acetylglucosamine-6-phosphate deacetylase [Leucobacter chromiireducens]|uniref:N-acetylglucosamine-6-phosphate deacetylase n=1 Tax=Leucobacter chromiireducens TaxID=283877 RepID=UPI003F7D545D
MSEIIAAGRVVTSTASYSPGWVEVAAGRTVALGAGAPPRTPTHDLGSAILVPGFVDIHVHGGGGADYPTGTAAAARAARAAHLAHGTTQSMASLVAASPDTLRAQLAALAPLVADGTLGGIHLEGPWISPARAGAHDPEQLRDPDLREIDALLAAAPGAIRMVTLAPELAGAIAAIERFRAAGVVVAIGHTDADAATVRAAIDAGATVATHLFNAMPPLHHRTPGPVLALLADPRVIVELIADGTHLDDALAHWVAAQAGPDRVALVTDAMGAAGCGDGEYRLGVLDVTVAGGVARLAGTETIAGSTVTMDALFRGAVGGAPEAAGAHAESRWSDAALEAAVRMTATTPARAARWAEVGDIAPGLRADYVALDAELQIVHVFSAGESVRENISTPRYSAELG